MLRWQILILEKENTMYMEHVNLTVSDLARSVKFYRELFGFDVRWEGTTSTGVAAAHVVLIALVIIIILPQFSPDVLARIHSLGLPLEIQIHSDHQLALCQDCFQFFANLPRAILSFDIL